MAVRGQFARTFGGQADPIFMVFDLARTADDHGFCLSFHPPASVK
jgi:hypothetical protein